MVMMILAMMKTPWLVLIDGLPYPDEGGMMLLKVCIVWVDGSNCPRVWVGNHDCVFVHMDFNGREVSRLHYFASFPARKSRTDCSE